MSTIDGSRPHSARIWNYWLGGKDNFAVDREAGDQVRRLLPSIVDVARADRAFLGRAVRYLAGEVGHPAVPRHRHRAADRGQHPRGRPADRPGGRGSSTSTTTRSCWSHARALLTSSPEGATDYIDADLRDPETILERGRAGRWTSPSRSR